MRIGELAKRTGTDIETIWYYENSGLLAEPPRNVAGYRDYTEEHQGCLQFIRHCRSLQLPLADIRALLDFKSKLTAECQGVNALLDHHIDRIRTQMEALRAMETQLTTLRQQFGEPHSVQECAIIQNLSESAGN